MRSLGVWVVLVGLCGCKAEPSPVPEPVPAGALAEAGADRAVLVGETLRLDVGVSEGVGFTWDLGDGRQVEGAQAEVRWEAPGTYALTLQVVGEDGGTRTDAAKVVVYLPPLAQRPSSGSTVAALPGGDALALTADAGLVARVGPAGEARWMQAVCEAPVQLAVAGEGVWVSCAEALWQLGLVSGEPLVQVDLPAGSRAAGLAATEQRVVVALAGLGALWVQEGEQGAVLPVGEDAHSVALVGERSFATRFRSGEVDGELYELGAPSLAVPFDVIADSDVSNRGVANLLGALAISPDGGTAYVGGLVANTARGAYRDGQALSFENTLRGVVVALDLESGAELRRFRMDDQGLVSALTLTPLGDLVLVGMQGSGLVLALDAYTGRARGSVLSEAQGLSGLALSEDGATLWVHGQLDRAVRRVDVADWRAPVMGPGLPVIADEPLDAQVLWGKRLFTTSADRRMSKDGYIACASCHPDGDQDGQTWDFTDRGEGLRRTMTLLGKAGTAMGPLHWTGNFDEVQDFEHDMRGPFGGTGLLDDASWASGTVSQTLGDPKAGLSDELDALAAYVSSLDRPLPSATPCDSAGEALFVQQGCAECHPAPLYTSSSLAAPTRVDIGTAGPGSGQRLGGPLDGFDVPTLLGLSTRPPYLHDGSAPTLEAAIAAHGGDWAPPAEVVPALAAYVRCL